MKFKSLKTKLLIASIIFAVIAISSLILYISNIHFYGEIAVNAQFKNTVTSYSFIAQTPTCKNINNQNINNSGYYIKDGYYRSLTFTTSNRNIINDTDTIYVTINGENIIIDKSNFSKYWEQMNSADSSHFTFSLRTETFPLGWTEKMLVFKNYSFKKTISFLKIKSIPSLVLYLFLLIVLPGLYLIVFTKWKGIMVLRFRFTKTIALIVCLIIFVLYAFVFMGIATFSDSVVLQGDYPCYQTEAVNISKGSASIDEDIFDKYKFDKAGIDSTNLVNILVSCRLNNITWVPPAYPFFMASIYSVSGVSPIIVRYIQLILLLIVAAFLPLLLYSIWHLKGFVIGLLSGLVFIITYYNISAEIMTEPLMIFFIFITLCSIRFYENTNSYFSAVLLGLVLAVSLLIKGVIVIFILLYFISVFLRNKQTGVSIPLKKNIVLIVAFSCSLLPWIIYSNLNNGILQKVNASKAELTQEATKIRSVICSIEKSHGTMEFDSVKLICDAEHFTLFRDTIGKIYSTINNIDFSQNDKKEAFITTLVNINSVITDLLKSPEIKLNNGQYLYLKKFIFISTNHEQNILESNNEKCIDGMWHRNDSIKLTYDRNIDDPSIIRVIRFYYSRPELIPVIFSNKLHSGYKDFPFFIIFIALIIADFIVCLFKNKVVEQGKVSLILFAFIVPGLVYFTSSNIFGFIICFVLAAVFIGISIVHKIRLILFAIPFSFNLLLLNFLLITLIFFGSKRITTIIDLIIIISATFYSFEYYTNIFKKATRGILS